MVTALSSLLAASPLQWHPSAHGVASPLMWTWVDRVRGESQLTNTVCNKFRVFQPHLFCLFVLRAPLMATFGQLSLQVTTHERREGCFHCQVNHQSECRRSDDHSWH